MLKKKLFLFLQFFLIFQVIFTTSAHPDSVVYDWDDSVEVFRITIGDSLHVMKIQGLTTTSDGVICVGKSYNASEYSDVLWIWKLDNSGDIVWQKNYTYSDLGIYTKISDDTASDSYNSMPIISLSTGGFLTVYVSGTFDAGFWTAKGLNLLKIDTNGNVVWTKNIYQRENMNNEISAAHLIELAGGEFVVGGYNYMNYQDGYSVYNTSYIMKMDANGNVLSYKMINSTVAIDRIHSIAEIENNLVFVTFEGNLYKSDLNLNILNHVDYSELATECFLTKCSANSFYFTYTNNSNYPYHTHSTLDKMNLDFSTIWETNFDTEEYIQPWIRMKTISDGGVVILRNDAFFRLDDNGDLLGEARADVGEYVMDLSIADNDDIVTCGYSRTTDLWAVPIYSHVARYTVPFETEVTTTSSQITSSSTNTANPSSTTSLSSTTNPSSSESGDMSESSTTTPSGDESTDTGSSSGFIFLIIMFSLLPLIYLKRKGR